VEKSCKKNNFNAKAAHEILAILAPDGLNINWPVSSENFSAMYLEFDKFRPTDLNIAIFV
jgi:hypothetical protein